MENSHSLKQYPLCVIEWEDAAYTYEDSIPDTGPGMNRTVGYVVEKNDEHVLIVFNFGDDDSVHKDGFAIPMKAVTSMHELIPVCEDIT